MPDSLVPVIWLLAASLGAVLAKDTAFVEVVLFESSPNGDYTTYTTGLQGRFSEAGATISAEGEIVQVRVFIPSSSAEPGDTRIGLQFHQAALYKTFFHSGCGGADKIWCACVCEREDDSKACKHMRSQDGSYLVEFIHRENMLLQVILFDDWCALFSHLR